MTSKDTHNRNRASMRKRLGARGVPEEEIERRIAIKRENDLRKRQLQRQEALLVSVPITADVQVETWERLSPDDSKFRPTRHDPLTTGAARVTGATATVVAKELLEAQ